MAARSTTFRKIFSLVLIRDFENNKILLGYKKRGFGANKWNGFGGKLDKSETILECAKRYKLLNYRTCYFKFSSRFLYLRELKEESGLDANEIKKIGYLEFEFENKNEILEAHIFESNKFSGEIEETEGHFLKRNNII